MELNRPKVDRSQYFIDQLYVSLEDELFVQELKRKNIRQDLIPKIFQYTRQELKELSKIEDESYKLTKLQELTKVLYIIKTSDTVSSYLIEDYLQNIVNITIETIVDEKTSIAIQEDWSIEGDNDYEPFYLDEDEVLFHRNWRIDNVVISDFMKNIPSEVVEILNRSYLKKKMQLVVKNMLKEGISPSEGQEESPFYIEKNKIKFYSRLGEGVWYSHIDKSIFKNIPDSETAMRMKEELNYMFNNDGQFLEENDVDIVEHVEVLAKSTLQKFIDRKKIDVLNVDPKKSLKLEGNKFLFISDEGVKTVLVDNISDQEIYYFLAEGTKCLEVFIKALKDIKKMKIYSESGGFDTPEKIKKLAEALINNPDGAKEMLTNMRYELYSLVDSDEGQFFGDELQNFFNKQGYEYISYMKKLVGEPIYAGDLLKFGGKDPNRLSPIDKIYDEDLAYLTITESHGEYLAYSRSGARGPGQITGPTAGLYGLRCDKFVDERLDPLATARQIRLHHHEISTRNISNYINVDDATRTTLYNNNYAEEIYLRANKNYPKGEPSFDGFLKEVGKRLLKSLEAGTHIVKGGENLWSIGKKYGIKVDVLRKLNPQIKNDKLSIGDSLKLGKNAKININRVLRENLQYPFKYYAVLRIIEENKTQSNPRLRLNIENEKQPVNFEEIKLSINENVLKKQVYTVKPGDNLYAIAKSINTNVTTLKKRNNLKSADIKAGQKLDIFAKTINLNLDDIADLLGMSETQKFNFFELNRHIVYAEGPRSHIKYKDQKTVEKYKQIGIQKNIFKKEIDGVSLYLPIGFARKFNQILTGEKGYFQASTIIEYKDGEIREKI